jgi:hypothetical protein
MTISFTRRAAAMISGLVVATACLAAPFWGAKEPRPFETPFGELREGEFTWAPEIAPAGPILVVVSLGEQRAYTYRNGVLIGRATISSGKKGHETPTGVFKTTFKHADHRSSIYNNAPMPYTQRFTSDGVALHAGGIPGYPESHGCVHLPSAFAKLLFEAAPVGMTVVVANEQAAPEEVQHPPFLAPVSAEGAVEPARRLAADEEFRWQPEKSPEGPLSLLLSRADARMVVLRNGVEIGRAKIDTSALQTPLGTHVYIVKQPPDAQGAGAPRWIGVGVPGHHDDDGSAPDPEAMRRIVVPSAFLAAVTPLLAPGTSLLVTDAPILEHTTGVPMAILSSHPDA